MGKKNLNITVEFPDNIESDLEILEFIRDTIQREIERVKSTDAEGE